jgi:hypothetical protein
VAPEWGAFLEVVHAHQQQQHHHHQHVEVHKRILQHEAVQQLQLVRPADELRLAAAKAAASGGLAAELRQAPPDKVLIGVHFPDVPTSALQRLGTAGASFHPSAAAAQDWRQPLLDVVAREDRSPEHLHLCQPELLSRSQWELDVAVCPQDLSEVLYWLSNQAAVHWLAPRPRLFYQNAVASAIVQVRVACGGGGSAIACNAAGSHTLPHTRVC